MPEAEPAPLTAPDDVAGILAALSADAGLPRAALAAAVARWDDIRPALHAQLQAYVDGGDRSDRAATLCLMAIYLMAQQRDTTGFALVCTLVRDREAVEAILSDGITEDLNSILVRLFDGDPAPLRALIEAADADEFVRSASFEALAWLTAAGRLDRDETAQYLRDPVHDAAAAGGVVGVGGLAAGDRRSRSGRARAAGAGSFRAWFDQRRDHVRGGFRSGPEEGRCGHPADGSCFRAVPHPGGYGRHRGDDVALGMVSACEGPFCEGPPCEGPSPGKAGTVICRGPALRRHRTRPQSGARRWPQRPLPLRQRQEVQEMLPGENSVAA